MKVLKSLSLMALLMSCMVIALFSCDDEQVITLVTKDSAIGDYTGNLIANGDDSEVVKVSVDKANIVIKDFPVDSIVKYIVPAEDLQDAMASVGEVNCNIGYEPSLFSLNLFLELNPAPLEFTMTLGGDSKEVNVGLSTRDENGIYNGTDNSLTFEIVANNVTVNGNAVTSFKSITYQFNSTDKE